MSFARRKNSRKDKNVDIDSSINSGIDVLEMSYNSKNTDPKLSSARDGEVLTPEEEEEVKKLPKSTWKSFVSPAERKKQQKLKAEAAAKKKEEEENIKASATSTDSGRPADIPEESDSKSVGSESTLTPEEKEKAAAIAKTSFVSPAERKRRQSLKLKEMEEKKKQEEEAAALLASVEENEDSCVKVKPTADELNALTAAQEAEAAAERERLEREAAEKKAREFSGVSGLTDEPSIADGIAAQDPSSSNSGGEEGALRDSLITSIPHESDFEKNKRAAIQRVMKDSTLSPMERNAAMQKIMKGEFENSTGGAAAVVAKGVPEMEESSSEETSSGEEEESSDEESEWSSSSGEYETDSDDEEESKVSEIKKKGDGDSTAQAAVAAASTSSITSKERVKELEAALDADLAKEAEAEKLRQSKLEAELDKELQNHTQLELEQKQRELEFQREEQQKAALRAATEEEVLRRVTAEKTASERKLQEEITALRLERERAEEQMRIQEETNRIQEKSRRLREETQREEARLRALQDERDRQMRLAQEESRRLQDQQRRLQAEKDAEQRRIHDQAELQHRLERERLFCGMDQDGQQRPIPLTTQSSPVVALRGGASTEPQATDPQDRSLRSSKLLAIRQGGGEDSVSHVAPRVSNRPPKSGSQIARAGRYDGVDDDELNWRLDAYASLSDYSIVVNRARPGPYAPDFDTADISGIDFVSEEGGGLKQDVYYVHKAMIAVGSRRSELLGRRIREAENRGDATDSNSSEVNAHETIMLESAADAMGSVLDFCYYHDHPLDIHKENAVPLVYLGKRYKIRALLEEAETYVMNNIVSTTAMYFLLDSYLFKLEEILSRSIDVTAAHLEDTVDFDPIYRLPPELFKRIILSKELKCESELLSLIVYSYCGEHHPADIDVEYFRDLTKPRLMPDIDPKVALMVLKLYIDLMLKDDPQCDIMEALPGDSLMNRCITVVAKHWQPEVCLPMMTDAEWDSNPATRRPGSEPAALHRLLHPLLQNYVLEKCILAAKQDLDAEKKLVEDYQNRKSADRDNEAKSIEHIAKQMQDEIEEAQRVNKKEHDEYRKKIEELELKAKEMEAQLEEKTNECEEYKLDLRQFRRVPGIHNFGEVSRVDPTIVDKTTCTYSANPDHHYPYHRRGNRRPTEMPIKSTEFGNLAKENGYIYDDGNGELLPVFYYQKRKLPEV